MKVIALALMVLTNAGSDTSKSFESSIMENLQRCERLKIDPCTFSIEDDTDPKSVIRKLCGKLNGVRLCSI